MSAGQGPILMGLGECRPGAVFNQLGECRPGAVFNGLGECRPGAVFSELGDCRSGEWKLGWVLYRHGAIINVLGHSGSRVRSKVRPTFHTASSAFI